MGLYGSHPEHGSSYSDAHEPFTWYGAKGAREACAYYSAGAMSWLRLSGAKPDDNDGEFLLAVQVAYGRYGDFTRADRDHFDKWEARGAERAQKIFGQTDIEGEGRKS